MMDRYSRHKVLLRALDDKIHETSVAVIGLGGLGSFLSNLLVRMGVKRIIIYDGGTVDLPDLQRQILYSEKDIGRLKAEAAKEVLSRINSEVEIISVPANLSHENYGNLHGVDVIFDATDNLKSRMIIDEIAEKIRVPWIYGTVLGFKGYVKIFYPDERKRFKDVFASKKATHDNASFGVFNATVSFVASAQLSLFLKLLSGEKDRNLYRLDLKNFSIERLRL